MHVWYRVEKKGCALLEANQSFDAEIFIYINKCISNAKANTQFIYVWN